MGYGLIAIFAGIILTLYYVMATEASVISKALVVALQLSCLACIFWLHRFSLAALFVMAGLGVFITFYRIVQEARSGRGH